MLSYNSKNKHRRFSNTLSFTENRKSEKKWSSRIAVYFFIKLRCIYNNNKNKF
jgi:hypothetical protein